MTKWLVTGGAGFIGANVARAMIERGDRVVIVDNFARPSAELNVQWLRDQVGDAFELVTTDVRNRADVEEMMRRNGDATVVVHLAAQVAVTSSVQEPREDFEVNALGTFNMLEAVRAHAPEALFINASTNKVYGDLSAHRYEEEESRYVDTDFPAGIPENHPLDPHSPYGCSKAAGDTYAIDYGRIYGMRTVSFRQSCVYGPRQFGIEDQGWVAWFALGKALGARLTIYGTGKQVRDLLHVDDLVDLYLRAAERPRVCAGTAFNIGGGPTNALSVLEVVNRLGIDDVGWGDERPGDQKVFVADVSRARAELSWEPTIGIDSGLDELVEWVNENADVASAVVGTPNAASMHGR